MKKSRKEPSRPRSHAIETEHRVAFESLLQEVGWVYRRLDSPDYGIDGQVEVFDAGDKSGLAFYVQLRATDEPNPIKARKIRLSADELEYYASKTEPVMVVRYASATKTMYWQWASTLRKGRKWSKEALSAFSFLSPREWTSDSPSHVRSQLENERAVALHNLRRPIGIDLRFLSPPSPFTATALKAELQGLEAKSLRVCRLIYDEESGPIQILVNGGLFHVALGVHRSYTVDFTKGQPPTARSVASDIWCVVGYLLGLAGEQSAGSVLIAQALVESKLAQTEDFAHQLATAMVSVGNLDAAEIALNRYASSVHDVNLLTPIVQRLPHAMLQKSDADGEKAFRICRRLVEQVRERFGDSSAAVVAYNLADGLPGGLSGEALSILEEVESLDPTYAKRDYFWRHRAMRQLDLDRLPEAAESAAMARKLGSAPENVFADIRVFTSQGMFKQAAELLPEASAPAHPDRLGALLGILSAILAEHSSDAPCTHVEEVCQHVEEIARDESVKDPLVTLAAWFMLWAKDFGRPDALINGLLGMGELAEERAEAMMIAEIAIEVGVEFYGSAFPAMMSEYMREAGVPDHFADAMVEAFQLKVRELETGDLPKELRLPNEDGTYTRLIRKDGGDEWIPFERLQCTPEE